MSKSIRTVVMADQPETGEVISGHAPRATGAIGLLGLACGIVLLVIGMILCSASNAEVSTHTWDPRVFGSVLVVMGLILACCGFGMFLGRKHFFMKLTETDVIISDYYRVKTVPLARIVSAQLHDDCIIAITDDDRRVHLSHFSSHRELQEFFAALDKRLNRRR